jgi:type II secretory ATPase GspE/PulE/Tfp pilus assembly ATPase PilB-like protein
MGVEPYQLAASLKGAAAQRLVRRLCPACRRARTPNDTELHFAEAYAVEAPVAAFDPVGCPQCHQSGFRNRIAIAEAYLTDEEILRAIADRRPSADVAALARRAGLKSMAIDGLDKIAEGLTTLEEVMAAVYG